MATKSKRSGFKQWPLYKKVLLILGILIALLAIAIFTLRTIHNQQVSADKARFARASKDIQSLAQQYASLSTPFSLWQNSYCYHSSPDFPPTGLRCNVAQYLSFNVSGISDANMLLQKLDKVSLPSFQEKGKLSRPFHSSNLQTGSNEGFEILNSLTDIESVSQSFISTNSGLGCTNTFMYANGPQYLLDFPAIHLPLGHTLLLDINCDASAKVPYYPIDESRPA